MISKVFEFKPPGTGAVADPSDIENAGKSLVNAVRVLEENLLGS